MMHDRRCFYVIAPFSSQSVASVKPFPNQGAAHPLILSEELLYTVRIGGETPTAPAFLFTICIRRPGDSNADQQVKNFRGQ